VIYPPANLSSQSIVLGDTENRDTITFFSRIVDYKRPEMVLELANQYRDMRFVIMGGVPPHRQPYLESLQRRTSELDLVNVEFLANPTDQTAREELARTRFYIFPAINEHFGMTTVEAIAAGAIPFVHNSGGQKEIVVDARLRFSDTTFFDQFEDLLCLPDVELNDIRSNLHLHIQKFSEEAFIRKIVSFLPDEILH
jgi:glycosyltransferase involved in cell wall biosynthesis